MNRAMRRASQANGRRMMKAGWTPFKNLTEEYLDRARRVGKEPLPGFRQAYKNALYIVQVFDRKCEWGNALLLMVRRNDEAPIRSWSHMQRIKNELVGPDRVAVEVYPAERDLVDQANMYHLWVLPEGFELPFGLHKPSR